MNFNWFTNILVNHPYLILTAVTVFSGTCIIIPFTFKTNPFLDFADPQLGFQTRGTVISTRLTAWKNLIKSTEQSGQFTNNPKELLERRNESLKVNTYGRKNKVGWKKRHRQNTATAIATILYEPRNHSDNSIEVNWRALKNLKVKPTKNPKDFQLEQMKGFFCGYPDKQYVHVIIKSSNNVNLFTHESLLTLCRLEQDFIKLEYYKDLCLTTGPFSRKCCRPWSLANYIAELYNRTSCYAIKAEDVTSTIALLKYCAKYFHNSELGPDCAESHCKAPEICYKNDAVYNILNFFTTANFLSPDLKDTDGHILLETTLFLPIACSVATLPYYHEMETLKWEYKDISIVAMELGLKNALFDECLTKDAWLMGSGALFIILCMWLYTNSLFLTFMTIIAIFLSLGISFFVYILIYELNFFPFMNLLAMIVAIGIGADDAFIFCKIWKSVKTETNCSLTKTMSSTFYHAFTSMFLASLTTSVAFLASFISSVTAIECFSLFAGTAVITNFLLMVTWFPACMVLWEKSCFSKINSFCETCLLASLQRWSCFSNYITPQWQLSPPWTKLTRCWKAKERCLLDIVINLRYLWLVVFSALGIGAMFVVLYYPKLQLPDSSEFQLFRSSHPFEQYEFVFKNNFWFGRADKADTDSNMNYKLPLRFVWGILPIDNGNHLNPYDLGYLELDPYFDMSNSKSQEWLLQFCHDLKRQPFYRSTLGALLPNCFIETFKKSMQRKCIDSIVKQDRTPCCKSASFPFNQSIFNECIIEEMADIYETPSEYLMPGFAGPKFSKDQFPTIKAVIVEYDSTYLYSMSFQRMNEFYNQVENWMQEQLKTAPDTMKNGWFISDLDFYDLQKELSFSTPVAIATSMALALTVLILSTLNLLTSLYAILTITLSIFVTIAILVLLGWKQNILESVAVTTAIGLTVDFSLHYSIHYRLCPPSMIENRRAATRYALSNMAGPALMATLTTGAAGAFMMPSIVLPYIEIGVFLVTVMSVSWIYATFFLGSLLAIMGPENQLGQFHYSWLDCCSRRTTHNSSAERARPVTSSVSTDTHELDSLSSKCGVRPTVVQGSLQRSVSNSTTGRNSSKYVFTDQSPSATSAITVIMADDN